MKRREFITLGGGGDDVAARHTPAATNGRGSTACGKRGRHQGLRSTETESLREVWPSAAVSIA